MASPTGHVLIAPDKFKGSLTASQVARHLAAGLSRQRPGIPLRSLPVADGGEGTVEAAVTAGFAAHTVAVSGPTGRPVEAVYAVREDVAVVELAQASGLHLLPEGRAQPMTASSAGTGELILAAVRGGAKRVVLGLGGSACTDGGAGMISALGGRLLDAKGAPLPPGGAALRALHALDLRGLGELSGTEFVVASDVDNPLLGRQGAASVYGPQKGATREGVKVLEAGLRRWADLAEAATRRPSRGKPGAGAAGGVGFAALAFLGARVEPGISYLLDLLGFTAELAGARLVITGEGSLDPQTLRGKAPVGVARAAARAGVPVVAVAGRRSLTGEQLRRARISAAYALTDIERDTERCMRAAGPLLEELTVAIADEWLR
ncbi:glycerate kinase [Actinocorallia sp. API 0066]|uniref:glycerate kinase n=1 Tax=Actinocorallia sp. API 0066 TaxID=2896846 RepID=UPI001E59FECB|nr:glycerate kinase [Actinocorallia sp. API 0066]MCD0451056.1 glycerate kinase [Actinocorallia sp. API 0066]